MAKAFYRSGMVQLSIDTCNQLCAASLSEMTGDNCVCFEVESQDIGRGHAELLALQVDRLLKHSNRSAAELSRIAVTVGPGSFTGQRVGLALARSMAMALKIEVVGINVLDALLHAAREALDGQDHYCAILDARRGGAYIKCVDAQGNVVINTDLLLLEEMNDRLKGLDSPIALIGNGANLVDNFDLQQFPLVNVELPGIETIARLGHLAAPTQEPVTPLYLRAPDAKPQNGKHLPLASQNSPMKVPLSAAQASQS